MQETRETEETEGLNPGSGRSLEEEMAAHSSTFAREIPWTVEPGGLPGVTKGQTRLSN